MGIKDTFEKDLEEYDEEKASSNEEIEEKGNKDITVASKEKEVASKCKAKGKSIAIEETKTPNRCGLDNAYSHTFYDMENERLFKNYSARGFIVERNI